MNPNDQKIKTTNIKIWIQRLEVYNLVGNPHILFDKSSLNMN